MGGNGTGNIESCVRCGSMFVYSGYGKRICKACREEEDAQFNIVKEYIYNNSGASVMDVAQATGVRVGRIKMFLKEGRLIIPDDSPIFLNCEICGTSIKYGRICRTCADNLNNEKSSLVKYNEYEVGEKPAKMRFINRNNE